MRFKGLQSLTHQRRLSDSTGLCVNALSAHAPILASHEN